jgi:hypothetical protein
MPHTCQRTHSPVTVRALANVAHSQRSPQRHKCAACAYEQGRQDGYQEGLAEARKLINALISRGVLRAEESVCPSCGDPHLEGSHSCRS